MTEEWMTPRNALIVSLYRRMPGAEMPPTDSDRGELWGEVAHTEHWEFCETVADMILSVRES